MLKGQFIYTDVDKNKTELSVEYSYSQSQSHSEYSALKIKDKLSFIKNYFSLLKVGKSPIVLNPSLPDEIAEKIAIKIRSDIQNLTDKMEHILCSSGTTSKNLTPKSFTFKIEQAIANAKAHYQSLEITESLNILFPLPLTHSFGVIVGVWGTLALNAKTYIYEEAPSAMSLLKEAKDNNIDLLYLTPSMARQIIKFKKRLKDIPEIKYISIGSSMLYEHELFELLQIFPDTQFFYTYGLTEMGPRVSTHKIQKESIKNKVRPISIGKPLDRVIMDIREDKLFIKSDYAARRCQDWYDSNDSAKMNDNNIFLLGRSDQTIIHQGINIYPDEVESVVSEFEDIGAFALIGLPSKVYGEIPVLVSSNEINEQELFSFLKTKIPETHLPKRVITNFSIPKTDLGKIKRAELIEKIKGMNL